MAKRKLEDTLKERSKDLEVKVELMDKNNQNETKKAEEINKAEEEKKAAEAKKAEEEKKAAEEAQKEKYKQLHDLPTYLL